MTFKMRGIIRAAWPAAWPDLRPALRPTPRLCALAVVLATLLATLWPQAAQAQVSEAVAETLMRLSGQWLQLDSLASQTRKNLVQGLASGESPPSAEVQQRVAAAVEAALGTQNMRDVARRVLATSLRAPYVPDLLRWYETPAAQAITQAEVEDTAADQGDLNARVSTGMAALQAATPARQALLARIVEVTRAPQLSADMVINLGVLVPLTLSRFVAVPNLPAEPQLRASMNEQRPQLLKAFEVIALAGVALAYRGIADEALAAYANFLASAAGEHYNDIGERAFEAAMLENIAAIKP